MGFSHTNDKHICVWTLNYDRGSTAVWRAGIRKGSSSILAVEKSASSWLRPSSVKAFTSMAASTSQIEWHSTEKPFLYLSWSQWCHPLSWCPCCKFAQWCGHKWLGKIHGQFVIDMQTLIGQRLGEQQDAEFVADKCPANKRLADQLKLVKQHIEAIRMEFCRDKCDKYTKDDFQ